MQSNDGAVSYLGMLYVIGGSRLRVFSYLSNRIWKKANWWKEKILSRGSKEVLIKSHISLLYSKNNHSENHTSCATFRVAVGSKGESELDYMG